MAGLAATVDTPVGVPPRVGLLVSAIGPPPGEDATRWMAGIRYEPRACYDPSRLPQPNCGPYSMTAGIVADLVDYVPTAIYGVDECDATDVGRDRLALAMQNLEVTRSAQVAREFWTGTAAVANGYPNRFLADPSADVVNSAPADPGDALACLEQALADCGGGERGMIHATRQTVSAWDSLHLLRNDGQGLLLTAFDTLVVPDAGYPGSSPDGDPAESGSVWAYATTLVTVRLGPVNRVGTGAIDELNRTTNEQTTYVTQVQAATWDGCCLLAAEIDLPLCVSPGS